MKIKVVSLLVVLMSFVANQTFAHSHYRSSSSRPVYLVQKDYSKNEYKFQNCTKHSLVKETTVYFYSNGTRNTYNNYTVLNSDGSFLLADCSKVSHTIYNDKHYLIFYKNKKYQLMDENGSVITVKKYTKMEEIAPNKLLVCFNKKYGIIDFYENSIVPLKYKSISQIDKNIFLTKLNGYFGIIDSENNTILENKYDKIKINYETFILTKSGKFGLADKNGKIILETEYDSIKNLGEYIKVKKDGKYGVYDFKGNKITNICYKKIKLDRNILLGKLNSGKWIEIKQTSTY